MKTHTILGIDLAGCMSGNSAYAYITWKGEQPHIIELIKEPKHKKYSHCSEFLEEMLSRHSVDAICIDAPFSLPRKLLDIKAIEAPREAKGEISNPYLFRYTDYWIYKHYKLRPMPPAGDRIGRLTARMCELLPKLEYKAPYITINKKKIPVYEVYPKQIALALGFKTYKKQTQELRMLFNIKEFEDEHFLDAFLCSYAGHHIIQGHTQLPPKEFKDEGWCYPLVLPH